MKESTGAILYLLSLLFIAIGLIIQTILSDYFIGSLIGFIGLLMNCFGSKGLLMKEGKYKKEIDAIIDKNDKLRQKVYTKNENER